MDFIRGRWYKKYINCPEDKRDYDLKRIGYMASHEKIAREYCKKYNPPDITEQEKKEISEYWAQFGIKIDNYEWHRMYYHSTGIHDPRFIPDLVVGFCVYPYYNDHTYEDAWRDKNMFERLLPNVPFPKTMGKCIRNRYYTNEDGYIEHDKTLFAQKVYDNATRHGTNEIIFKRTRDTGFGKGVGKYTVNSLNDVLNAISEWEKCENYIIQECIRQHECLKSFNESSSNMIRVLSWRHGNDVDIMFAAVRAGIPGTFTDVAFVNGVELVNIIGITNDGYFSTKMVNQDGQTVRSLPDGVKVPSWEKIVKTVKENHLQLDNFDFVGWDFTIDSTGEPKCFEWNISWPGTVLYQYSNGPLYGDKTDEVFAFLKDEKNRYNYIPAYMRT